MNNSSITLLWHMNSLDIIFFISGKEINICIYFANSFYI